MAPTPTLADLARQAGVSTFTVSLALRRDPRVAPATSQRVLAIAAQLGYRPNPLVAALMSGVRLRRRSPSGRVIAYVGIEPPSATSSQDFYQREIQRGAERRAWELGFRLDPLYLSALGGNARRLRQVIAARGIHGVVIAPGPDRSFALDLDWPRIACIAALHTFSTVPVDRVSPNHFGAMNVALDAARRLGWRRPGLVLSRRMLEEGNHHFAARYLAQIFLAEGSVPIPPLLFSDRQDFLAWVRRHRVGVVFSGRSLVHAWLTEAGYEVGRDIGFAHLDCGEHLGRFAGIHQRMAELGATLIELLVQKMHASEFGLPRIPRNVELDCVWHDGPSLPAKDAALATASKAPSRK